MRIPGTRRGGGAAPACTMVLRWSLDDGRADEGVTPAPPRGPGGVPLSRAVGASGRRGRGSLQLMDIRRVMRVVDLHALEPSVHRVPLGLRHLAKSFRMSGESRDQGVEQQPSARATLRSVSHECRCIVGKASTRQEARDRREVTAARVIVQNVRSEFLPGSGAQEAPNHRSFKARVSRQQLRPGLDGLLKGFVEFPYDVHVVQLLWAMRGTMPVAPSIA